jgi:hypothetical protein
MENAFKGVNNAFVVNATDTPDLSIATSTKNMFANVPNLTGNLNNWNL